MKRKEPEGKKSQEEMGSVKVSHTEADKPVQVGAKDTVSLAEVRFVRCNAVESLMSYSVSLRVEGLCLQPDSIDTAHIEAWYMDESDEDQRLTHR